MFGVAGDDCKPVADGRSSQERVDSGEDLAALARLSFPLSPQVSAIEIDGQDTFSETSNERTVVDAVDLLIAIWNGKPARGLGGTADVVSYALNLSKRVLHINPDSRSVSEIL